MTEHFFTKKKPIVMFSCCAARDSVDGRRFSVFCSAKPRSTYVLGSAFYDSRELL